MIKKKACNLRKSIEEALASRVLSELMGELAFPECVGRLGISKEEIKGLPRGLSTETVKKAVDKMLERLAEEAYKNADFDSNYSKEPPNTIGGGILLIVLASLDKKAILSEVLACAGKK